MATPDEIDPELRQSMDASLQAYRDGDLKFFDYLSPDVRVYGLDSSEPLLGRVAFEDNFGPTLASTKRSATPLFQDVQFTGKQAIVSQGLSVEAEGFAIPIRQTVIWDLTDAGWRMSHIHNARTGQAVTVGQMPTSPAAIRVLNERIATVAAIVGVAQ